MAGIIENCILKISACKEIYCWQFIQITEKRMRTWVGNGLENRESGVAVTEKSVMEEKCITASVLNVSMSINRIFRWFICVH